MRQAECGLHTVSTGGSKGGARDSPPGSNFFHFHAVFGKIFYQIIDCSGGSKGGSSRHAPSPTDQNFFNFMRFFRKNILGWRPFWGVGAPSYERSWIRLWIGIPTLRVGATPPAGKTWIRHCITHFARQRNICRVKVRESPLAWIRHCLIHFACQRNIFRVKVRKSLAWIRHCLIHFAYQRNVFRVKVRESVGENTDG